MTRSLPFRRQGKEVWHDHIPVTFLGPQHANVTVVWDGKELNVFHNGRGSGSTHRHQVEQPRQPTTEKMYLGSRVGEHNTDYYHHLQGTFHACRLSITARYTKNFTPARNFEADEHTLSLYHFDEGSGDVLRDSSGNGHHGKIVGAKWVRVDGALPVRYALERTNGNPHAVSPVKVDLNEDFSVEAWVLPPQSPNGKGEVFNLGNQLIFTLAENHHNYILDFPGSPEGLFHPNAPWDRRIHVAAVRHGDRHLLFLDGNLVADNPAVVRERNEFETISVGFGEVRIDEFLISQNARYTEDFTPSERFVADKHTLALYHYDEGARRCFEGLFG